MRQHCRTQYQRCHEYVQRRRKNVRCRLGSETQPQLEAQKKTDNDNDIVVYDRVNCEGMDGPGLISFEKGSVNVITQYLRGVWPQSTLLGIAADPMVSLEQLCKACPRWQVVRLGYNVPA